MYLSQFIPTLNLIGTYSIFTVFGLIQRLGFFDIVKYLKNKMEIWPVSQFIVKAY